MDILMCGFEKNPIKTQQNIKASPECEPWFKTSNL